MPKTCSGRSATRSTSSCQGMDEVPEDLQALEELLSDTYFCNFSLFQSIPDSWAIKQLFPVMPIHRLDRAAGQSRGDRRHHLRLGRQARSVHRPPRRQEDDPAAPLQRRAVLPRRVPGRRLPGNPRRPAQPARRHPRRARLARRATATKARARASSTSSRATRSPKCCSYVEFDPEVLMGKLRRDVGNGRARRAHGRPAGRPSDQVLRRGAAGLHLPRRSQRGLTHVS